MKKHNFSAGPAILPKVVFEEAAAAVSNYHDLHLSILELSHRGKEIVAVMDEAVALVRDLMQLSNDHEVLFLTGGASSQFFMVPLNCLPSNGTAAYLNTGRWADNAIKEAQAYGKVEVVASSKEEGFSFIPKSYQVPDGAAYLHFTSNNTVSGSQYQDLPETNAPLVCDMSSDLFSRPMEFSRFGLIYAGAQKNLGPAGVTLVVVNKNLLGKVDRHIPTMLDYRTHIKKNSSFNTPPVYPIFVSMLTMRWIKAMGGLEAMEKRNREKADLLYAEIDRNPLFEGIVAREDRSMMNATFKLSEESEALNQAFLKACADAHCVGLKGHRSVGGFRASMYNALDKESVSVLVEVMQEFERSHG